jgi:hypothetical protein
MNTVVLTTFLFSGMNLSAQSAAPADLLRQAYTALSAADHDYQGHRIRAMKQIEMAGTVIGVNLAGDGKGHEKQGVSDQQLRTAQGLLQQARPGLPVKAQRHVDKALAQLSIALSIK